MQHRMLYEEQVLDFAFRKKVIQEIMGAENSARKAEALKRYDIYKDKSRRWVIKALEEEGLMPETVAMMTNRASNISVGKKIVDKRARVYKEPPMRIYNDGNNDDLNTRRSDALELLDWNEVMKKADRYRELHRNCMVTMLPRLDQSSETDPEVYKLSMQALPPWRYDVIEDYHDREKMRCLIISDYKHTDAMVAASEHEAGVHRRKDFRGGGDGTDQVIADSPEDAKTCEIIWWTGKYHFTTDQKGNILQDKSPENNENPIRMIPACNIAQDQDGQFWAEGGDDLIDGSILVNKLLTDLYYVEMMQGFGQMVITGKNITNQKFKTGPNNAILIDYDEGDPAPSVDILSASPPISDWISSIELYVAMLLTTNNLSPGNVASTLNINNAASGIALMIELAEVTEDITEKQNDFANCERKLDEIMVRWVQLYAQTNELNERWAPLAGLEEIDDMTVKFADPKPPISEADKLEMLKKRKDLGINDMIDLMLMDNPDMTREEAEQKLLDIQREKLERATAFMGDRNGEPSAAEESESDDADPAGTQGED